MAECPDPAAFTRLLSLARKRGFTFTSAGEHGSLWGERVTARWRDVVFLGATGHSNAARASIGPLLPRVNPYSRNEFPARR